ncbi:phage tail sheath family protein [Serratia rubidaea]|uniref:phage tail sheath family protein n=1 Tax=Serratia rubidaea TaxID=61652 RepID=UPI001786917B|nr:phage tail sheath C-terminal domain-containing protein [Serratia rubidaea]MBD8451064.1 phage tail sheath family protein [Serratia rubidaea]
MITFPKAPGVYIDELETPSFSIGNAPTAVPVFVVGPAASEPWWDPLVGPLKIDSFNDFLQYENKETASSQTVSLSTFWQKRSGMPGPAHHPLLRNVKGKEHGVYQAGDPWDKVFAPSLKAYFDNGGGYCYVCPNDKLERINDLPDATLIVQCGQIEVGVTAGIMALCQPGSGLFALLDGPKDEGKFDKNKFNAEYETWVPSDCAAIYYPWLKANWTLPDNEGNPTSDIHLVAPSAVAAGLICKTDQQRGTWKSPANVSISAGLAPAVKVDDATQALYTGMAKSKISVNMLRTFSGRGSLVWGARTMTADGNNWAYINVRRTFDMVERNIAAALEVVLFEHNGQSTWEAVRSTIDNYLFSLWSQGALLGESPAKGYFIHVGENITMSQTDIADGILRVRIGLAVVRPAEYVTLDFTQQLASGG